MPTLSPQERDSLHREVRDRDPNIWEPACQRLGQLAATEQAAYTTLCDLLLSAVPELRLRGLVSLRTLAPVQPEKVLSFLTDRVDEARITYDPVILDAIFFVFAALPNQFGQSAVSDYLSDDADVVRAAAAAALPFWSDWPQGTLSKVAADSSSLVRAGLLTALAHFQDSDDRRTALSTLEKACDPNLKALLEELREGSTAPTANLWPEPLEDDQVQLLLQLDDPSPIDVGRLELLLDSDPALGIALIRRDLNEFGGVVVLEHLAHLCRNKSLGTLFHAWHTALTAPEDLAADEYLLLVLGVLESGPEEIFLSPLKEFVKACYNAVECEDSKSLLTWCCTQQVKTATLAVWDPSALEGASLAPEAQEWLNRLTKIGADFQSMSLFQLSHLSQELARTADQLTQGCPRPERDLLMAVLANWDNLLEHESDTLMGGGAS